MVTILRGVVAGLLIGCTPFGATTRDDPPSAGPDERDGGAPMARDGGAADATDGAADAWCPAGALFCAGFDDSTVVETGWTAVDRNRNTTIAVDETRATSAPRSARFMVASDNPTDAHLKKVLGTHDRVTVSFDVQLRDDQADAKSSLVEVAYLRFGTQCALSVKVGDTPGLYLETDPLGDGQMHPGPGAFGMNTWAHVSVALDNVARKCAMKLDGKDVVTNVDVPATCYVMSTAIELSVGPHYTTKAHVQLDNVVVTAP